MLNLVFKCYKFIAPLNILNDLLFWNCIGIFDYDIELNFKFELHTLKDSIRLAKLECMWIFDTYPYKCKWCLFVPICDQLSILTRHEFGKVLHESFSINRSYTCRCFEMYCFFLLSLLLPNSCSICVLAS